MAEYKLRTIKDIFDIVPVDRIEACMSELTTLLIQSKGMGGLISETLSASGGPPSSWLFPDEITWKDDGAGQVQSNMHVFDEVLTVKTTHSPERVE